MQVRIQICSFVGFTDTFMSRNFACGTQWAWPIDPHTPLALPLGPYWHFFYAFNTARYLLTAAGQHSLTFQSGVGAIR